MRCCYRDGCTRRPRSTEGVRLIHLGPASVHAPALGSALFAEMTVVNPCRLRRADFARRPRARSGAVTRQLVERSILETFSFDFACARAVSIARASSAP